MAARLLRASPATASFTSTTPFAATVRTSAPLFSAPSSLFHRRLLLHRTMSSAPTKTEWLAVIPDKPNTLAKRLEVRPTHFANLEAAKQSGNLKFGGAILHDVPADPSDATKFDFAGSSIMILAETKAEVIEFLKQDVYYKEGVWDVENAQVYSLKTAFRYP